jgi:hypothetical protein
MGRAACIEPQCLYKGTLYLYLAGVIKEVFDNMRMHGREYFKIKEICSRVNFPPSSQTALRNEHADYVRVRLFITFPRTMLAIFTAWESGALSDRRMGYRKLCLQ